jgi:phosphatidylcholine synthase
MAVWAVLAILTVIRDFNVAMPITAALCAIALYVVCGDAVIRVLRPENR